MKRDTLVGDKHEEKKPKKGRGLNRWRLLTLGGAFLLVVINPFVTYYLHFTFVQGWYQSLGIGSLWFVSPLEGLESLLISKSFYGPSLVGMAVPVLVALFLGRVFCSWICPVSFILEVQDRIRKVFSGKRYLFNGLIVAKRILWVTLMTEILLSMILGVPLFVFLSPPGLVGREVMMLAFFGSLPLEGGILLLIVMLELLTRRFFCRSFCPLGGLLAFIGRKRNLVIDLADESCSGCRQCDFVCPMGLRPSVGESRGAYCWNCGECVACCDNEALKFHWR
ncbi:4Fe-4S binding protein [Desulforhopalus singaporensis]|uniref:Ferredoxin-type protein NapH n=1 Tax=Desulforhopalus singaporensis TaxID=91360 RepID=A0A1H0TH81_9BACT|nr:4Fe-4S binding protein [Desulforhopalus singaporensis]SDP53191.1 ferredoxin-type protein NapH [Desulforhopalus singaporensis]